MAPRKNKKNKNKSKQKPKPSTSSDQHQTQQQVESSQQSQKSQVGTIDREVSLFQKVASELIFLEWRDLPTVRKAKSELMAQIKQICSEKRMLALSGIKVTWKHYRNCLNLVIDREHNETDALTSIQHYDMLVALLTKVRSIAIHYHARLDAMFPALINRWLMNSSNDLSELHIDGGPEGNSPHSALWWNALTSIPSMRLIEWSNMPQLPLTMGTKTESLSPVMLMHITNYRWNLVEVIRQLGEGIESFESEYTLNNRLVCDSLELERVLTENPNIGKNLTNFRIKFVGQTQVEVEPLNMLKLYQVVCRQFRNLGFLHISGLLPIPMEFLLANLVHLPMLIQTSFEGELIRFLPEAALRLTPLRSVTNVYFEEILHSNYTVEQFKLTIVPLFPNLRMLKIMSDCNDFVDTLESQIKMFFPQMVTPNIAFITPKNRESQTTSNWT